MRKRTDLYYWTLRALLLVAILAVWEFASGPLIPTFMISKPSLIFDVLLEWTEDGRIFFHAAITAVEAFSGFVVGSILGMTIGLLLGRIEALAKVIEPFIVAFNSLPKIALAPLFILWFGIGLDMKVALTATIVFFLVFYNTYTGVKAVSPELEAIMKLMGAKEIDVLKKVVIPSAVTWVFAGLRISVPYALIGAIVGELIAANRGLGFLLSSSAGQFQTAGVFAALVAITLLSFMLNALVDVLANKTTPWLREQDAREFSI
jgi:NitT/TauT family transport system permease protein